MHVENTVIIIMWFISSRIELFVRGRPEMNFQSSISVQCFQSRWLDWQTPDRIDRRRSALGIEFQLWVNVHFLNLRNALL